MHIVFSLFQQKNLHGDTALYSPPLARCARRLKLADASKGIRTSQDLDLAAGKRALPLLLAMADSPAGSSDAVIQGLVFDVLCKVAALERSGARCDSAWRGTSGSP